MKARSKVNGKVKDSKLVKKSIKILIEENREVFDRLSR